MLNIGNLMVDSLDYILIVDKHFRIVYIRGTMKH